MATAEKRIEKAEQRQRQLAAQLSEKKAMRLSIFESKMCGDVSQAEFREMADILAADIAQFEAAQRQFIEEAEAARVFKILAWRIGV